MYFEGGWMWWSFNLAMCKMQGHVALVKQCYDYWTNVHRYQYGAMPIYVCLIFCDSLKYFGCILTNVITNFEGNNLMY